MQDRPAFAALPMLSILIGVLAMALAGPIILLAQHAGVGFLAIPTWRLLAVAAILFPFCARAFFGDIVKLTWRERLALFVAGTLYGGHFALFTVAFAYTTKESVVVLIGAQPLMAAAVGAAFLRERITGAMMASSVVALVGLGLFVAEDFQFDPSHLIGDAMVLACGLLIVICYSVGRRLRAKTSLVAYLCWLYFLGGLTCLACALIARDPLWGYSFDGWMWLIVAIIVPTLIGHSMFHYAVKYVNVFYINLAILGEPVVALLFMTALQPYVQAFAKSELTVLKIVGTVLLLLGVAAGLRSKR